jgi:hypothetical protein
MRVEEASVAFILFDHIPDVCEEWNKHSRGPEICKFTPRISRTVPPLMGPDVGVKVLSTASPMYLNFDVRIEGLIIVTSTKGV